MTAPDTSAKTFTLRWWPATLFGRLVLILVVGMFAGQLLTSTIWFDSHDNRTLEIPTRLFGSRLADTLRLLEQAPDDAARRTLIHDLSLPRYRMQLVDAPAAVPAQSIAHRAVADLLTRVVDKRLGEPVDVDLLDARIRDDAGRDRGMLSLFDSRMPSGDFHVQTKVGTLGWLDVTANEGQAGMHSEPRALVLDYLLRIYLIRFVAIVLIALIAVRFAVRPLRHLAAAAAALGTDIHRPPLTIAGPREVRTAAQSFNAMQRQLIDSIGARTRMLASISHDLRSPLTRLRLRTEMLTDVDARERMRGDLEEMEAMIRATLDFVQGIEITEPRHDVDIDSMLQGLCDDALEAGDAIQVSGRARGPVAGYPRNLKRCLQNLLDNAIRHGGSARVAIEDDEQRVTIVVSDDGPGLDDALLERVFEPYFRAPAASKVAASGTGLGLTIARSIATAHGGGLALRNRPGGGLDAMLTLQREVLRHQ